MKKVFFLLTISFLSCEQLLIEDDLENNFVNNFEIFWDEFDQHYSFFELKNIDWDSVYNETKPIVENLTNANDLRDVLANIVLSLEDGHSNLYAPTRTYAYNFRRGFPENSPDLAVSYLERNNIVSEELSYGELKNTNLGYFRIKSFFGTESDFKKIDEIIEAFEDKDGLIIDVRHNGGGLDQNAKIIASRFNPEKRLYRRTKRRNGPEHTDFTPWLDHYIEPAVGSEIFIKPVIVLTNRSCFSATEGFILSMKILSNVRTVGGITGGGSGKPIFRDLPIGWDFRLSSWLAVTPDNFIYEGIGLAPDISFNNSEDDVKNKSDMMLEEAIKLLE